ncbi:uncharacterized protein LOC124896708 [Capsicum annuum]|uniref:uncharacterized protein LOC124896708 n=1 Tax=Capsicum annuum TaxID=4072 RepID=UPI001FB15502|nr:uncharacterized protein LOC124896708 [Capsicum annuum]
MNDDTLAKSEKPGDLEEKSAEVEQLSKYKNATAMEYGKGKKVDASPTRILRPPPPISYRLKKKTGEGKFCKFIDMLKQLSMNMPLVEVLETILGYTKFMKDLVTKKTGVSYELVENLYHCSAIDSRSLVQKKDNLGAFTVLCMIEAFSLSKALCYLGALDFEVHIILGRPSLGAERVVVDMEEKELKFSLNDEKVSFDISNI